MLLDETRTPGAPFSADPYGMKKFSRRLEPLLLAREFLQEIPPAKDFHVHHHLAKRGKLGDDALDNLIALCASCHRERHGG